MPLGVLLAILNSNSNNTSHLELWAAIGAVVGVVLFVRGFQMLRVKRLILNTPTSRVRSASMGLVEITGLAKGPSTIPAGVTGEACYYYRAVIWQLRQSGKNQEWKQVACESLYVPFFVEDATGQLLIDPQGADFDIERNFKEEFDRSFFSGDRNVLPENVANFLARNGISFNENTRVEEYCIKPDNPLFVFGTLCTDTNPETWDPAPHIAAGTSFHAQLNFLGAGGGVFSWIGLTSGTGATFSGGAMPAAYTLAVARARTNVAAKPAPAAVWSEVSMDEVALGRKSAQQSSPAAATSVATVEGDAPGVAASPDSHPSSCLAKGAGGNPFMISWRSQREVVQSLAWKSALCIWGGPILTLVCLYILALCFGWT
jgi:hypothetical protein